MGTQSLAISLQQMTLYTSAKTDGGIVHVSLFDVCTFNNEVTRQ